MKEVKTIALTQFQKSYKWKEKEREFTTHIVVSPAMTKGDVVIKVGLTSDNPFVLTQVEMLRVRRETLKHLSDLLVDVLKSKKI